MKKNTILCLMGPTASGKTDLACRLADERPVEIISVDSAMIYREMYIGTAKPDAETLKKYPHQLIDIRDPTESYSAADFSRDAEKAIQAALNNNRLPVLVGGSMLYFKALLHGIADMPSADEATRTAIQEEATEKGWQHLHAQLAKVDPDSAQRIHANDPQRIARALEIFRATGKTLTQWWHDAAEHRFPYNAICVGLIPEDRDELHARIAQRLDQMFAAGFVEEVQQLIARYPLDLSMPALRCVGYRQVWQYLQEGGDLQTCREKSLFATRQLAKRQLTWLRRWPKLEQIPPKSLNNLAQLLRCLPGL